MARAALGVGRKPRRPGDPTRPQDPQVARWMAIDDQGDGIHGTNESWSIGSAASHGCIRMLVPDVVQLYSMTPLGSPVYVI